MVYSRTNTTTTNIPNGIKQSYFITLSEGIRYCFNKKGTNMEASFIALVLSELFSLRYVQPKAVNFGGNFFASVSDLQFYTGLDTDVITASLKRLLNSKLISCKNSFDNYEDKDYHTQYIFNINDDRVNDAVTQGELRFKEAKSKHTAEKLAAISAGPRGEANEIDVDKFFNF